jgi:hypothetical protein
MEKKKREGLQIRFNPDSEGDIIEFFGLLKKAEVHIVAISAFRMYMRSVGFYEKRLMESAPFALKIESGSSESKPARENDGVFDEDAFEILNGMFESENEL